MDPFPYGWSYTIEDFCEEHGHHPDCMDPHIRDQVKTGFILGSIDNPQMQSSFNDHISTIHAVIELEMSTGKYYDRQGACTQECSTLPALEKPAHDQRSDLLI